MRRFLPAVFIAVVLTGLLYTGESVASDFDYSYRNINSDTTAESKYDVLIWPSLGYGVPYGGFGVAFDFLFMPQESTGLSHEGHQTGGARIFNIADRYSASQQADTSSSSKFIDGIGLMVGAGGLGRRFMGVGGVRFYHNLQNEKPYFHRFSILGGNLDVVEEESLWTENKEKVVSGGAIGYEYIYLAHKTKGGTYLSINIGAFFAYGESYKQVHGTETHKNYQEVMIVAGFGAVFGDIGKDIEI